MSNYFSADQAVVGDKAHLWIQLKGTDLCADVHCECGHLGHIDGDFNYEIKCEHCGKEYYVGSHVFLYPKGEFTDG